MTDTQPGEAPAPKKARPAPGERRLQILQALAVLLEQPGGERVTTAALASRLGISEAALYRQFASKAQMFEGLMGFVEDSCMGLVQQVDAREPQPVLQVARIVAVVLQFVETNPGMARVLAGDALVLEHPRLQARVNLLWDKLESVFKQRLREAASPQAVPQAAVLLALVMGRVQRYARSGFQRKPTDDLTPCLACVLPGIL